MHKIARAGLPVAVCAALASSVLLAQAPTATAQDAGATVLTLEGGLAGIQHLFHFTPKQLRGSLCASPNHCQPVDYPAWPLGQYFNDLGADRLQAAVDALPDSTGQVVLFGHSQGGQVIYTALRRWAADPGSAPDPARVSWVSIGNPENALGGQAPRPLPVGSPYSGIEVIRQYDGWADTPSDRSNLLAMLNTAVGKSTTHVFGYFNVDLNDPGNVRYTPAGSNITYVYVPTAVMPLVAGFGPLAPVLDKMLRPIVESAYHRPVSLPGSNPSAAVNVSSPMAARTVAVPRSAAVRAAPTVAKPAAADRGNRTRSAAAVKPAAGVRAAATIRSGRS